MFFRIFQVFHLKGNKAYKLKLSKKWKIYNVFQVLLLEQDIIIKEWIEKVPKSNTDNNSKEY